MTKRKRVHKHDDDKPATVVEKPTTNETVPTCMTQTNPDRDAIITPRWFATMDLTSVTPQFPILKISLNKSYKIRVLLKRSVTFHLKNHFDNNLSNYKIFN